MTGFDDRIESMLRKLGDEEIIPASQNTANIPIPEARPEDIAGNMPIPEPGPDNIQPKELPKPYEKKGIGDPIKGKYKFIHPRKTTGCNDPIASCLRPLIMFVGGARDVNNGNVLQPIYGEPGGNWSLRFYYDQKHDVQGNQDVGYCSCHNRNAKILVSLAKEWNQNNQKVCFVGHSYGGDTATDAADKFDGEIELLVTLDPVAPGKKALSGKRKKPKSVKTWINVYVDYANIKQTHLANRVAKIGGYWGKYVNADMNQPFAFTGRYAGASGEEHLYANYMFNYVYSRVAAISGNLR